MIVISFVVWPETTLSCVLFYVNQLQPEPHKLFNLIGIKPRLLFLFTTIETFRVFPLVSTVCQFGIEFSYLFLLFWCVAFRMGKSGLSPLDPSSFSRPGKRC